MISPLKFAKPKSQDAVLADLFQAANPIEWQAKPVFRFREADATHLCVLDGESYFLAKIEPCLAAGGKDQWVPYYGPISVRDAMRLKGAA